MTTWRRQLRTSGRQGGKTTASITELRRIVKAGGHAHVAGRRVELCVTGECPAMRLSKIPPAQLEELPLLQLAAALTPHAYQPNLELMCTFHGCGRGPEAH